MKHTIATATPPRDSILNRIVKAWPVQSGWIALGLLFGLLFSIGVYVGLSNSRNMKDNNSLPPTLATELERGTQLFEQGQLAKAETLYRQLVEDFPAYPQGYNNLAALFALRGDLDKSRNLLEQAMATDNDYTTIYRNLGTIYAEMARDSYGRALQLEPVDLRAQLQILDLQGAALLVSVENQAIEPSPVAQAKAPAAVTRQQVPEASLLPAAADQPPAESQTSIEGSPADRPIELAVSVASEPVDTPVETVITQLETPLDFIHRWAAAWAAQDVDAYFDFYADNYIPNSHKTRSGWEKKRKSRIIRPEFIEIGIDQVKIITSTEGHVELELIQSYRNNRFHDKTRKRFELKRRAESWAIINERSLGNVN